MKDEKINPGGMFRCCVMVIENRQKHAEEGEIITCPHCKDQSEFKNGEWRWVNDNKAQKEKA